MFWDIVDFQNSRGFQPSSQDARATKLPRPNFPGAIELGQQRADELFFAVAEASRESDIRLSCQTVHFSSKPRKSIGFGLNSSFFMIWAENGVFFDVRK
jgi:hypothetical protein